MSEILTGGKVHRCSICNCTSVPDIETDLGDFKEYTSFTPDPKDPLHFICVDCSEEIQQLRYDYEFQDYMKELKET